MGVEHKRPLYAFAVLAIVCGLFLGHALRSDALVGVFRAVVVSTPPAAPEPVTESVRIPVAAPTARVAQPVRRSDEPPRTESAATTSVEQGNRGDHGNAGRTGRDSDPAAADTPTDTTGTVDPGVVVVADQPVPADPPTVTTPDVDSKHADEPAKDTATKDWAANRPDDAAKAVEKAAEKAARGVDRGNRAAERAAEDLAGDVERAAEAAERAAEQAAEEAQRATEQAVKDAKAALRTTGLPAGDDRKDSWVP